MTRACVSGCRHRKFLLKHNCVGRLTPSHNLGALGLVANPLLGSSQARAENRTVPTPRDRAEPLVPRVPPPIPRLFFFPTSFPFSPPCAGRPGGSGSFSAFCLLGIVVFLALLPFWHCCLLGVGLVASLSSLRSGRLLRPGSPFRRPRRCWALPCRW